MPRLRHRQGRERPRCRAFEAVGVRKGRASGSCPTAGALRCAPLRVVEPPYLRPRIEFRSAFAQGHRASRVSHRRRQQRPFRSRPRCFPTGEAPVRIGFLRRAVSGSNTPIPGVFGPVKTAMRLGPFRRRAGRRRRFTPSASRGGCVRAGPEWRGCPRARSNVGLRTRCPRSRDNRRPGRSSSCGGSRCEFRCPRRRNRGF